MGRRIRKDLSGQTFGYLTVIKPIDTESNEVKYLVKCACGKETIVSASHLRSGHTTSCGCMKTAKVKKHGFSHTRLFRVWIDMKRRCYNPNCKIYALYGLRGIKVCDEWLGQDGSKHFCEWAINNGYNDNLTIDRIDVNGNYEPSNCRWTDSETQSNNRRTCKYIEFNGKTQTLAQWARGLGIEQRTLCGRLQNGWSVEKALTEPVNHKLNHYKKELHILQV